MGIKKGTTASSLAVPLLAEDTDLSEAGKLRAHWLSRCKRQSLGQSAKALILPLPVWATVLNHNLQARREWRASGLGPRLPFPSGLHEYSFSGSTASSGVGAHWRLQPTRGSTSHRLTEHSQGQTDNAAVAPLKARLACLQSASRVATLTTPPARWPPTEGSVNMAKEQHGTWFGFGFCGFGQVLGSGDGRHSVHSPEPLCASEDVCRVSASWSYTALVTRGGRVELSGSVNSSADGCRDAWASEGLLVVVCDKDGSSTELRAWAPGSALQGEPLWVQNLVSGAEDPGEDEPSSETRAGTLPLLPSAHAYVNPQPPFCQPLAPELRVRQLELGAEHVLMLCEAGQVFSWGGGRHGQLGHGTLEAELEPRLLEALQGLWMAEVAAGGWHSVCVSETGDIYIWGWNESGQLALPIRSPTEDRKRVSGAATELNEDCLKEEEAAMTDVGAPAPFIAIQPFPALLDLPMGSDAVKASCGSRHTAVVTRTGELYTWGWGKYGQLGHKDSSSLERPCRVEYFAEKQLQVRAVTCGPWNTYVYAVEREEI